MDGGGILFILIVIGAGWLIWATGPLALFILGCGFAVAGVVAGGGNMAALGNLVSVIMILGGATVIGLGLILHELRIMSGRYGDRQGWRTKWLDAHEKKDTPRHPKPNATTKQKYPPARPEPQAPPASTLDPTSGRW